jgi:glycine/D-amino acid oxidase-like deaminating enzyme
MTIPVGFAINPLKFLLGLVKAANDAGASVLGNSPVTKIASNNGIHVLSTPNGMVEAHTLILATNGYSCEDVPGWMAGRYLPVQSNILVTRPLTGEEVQAQGWTTAQMTYDTRKLLHYFRLMPDNRVLFGMRGGITADKRTLQRRKRLMRNHFDRMFPAWSKVETPHFWSGLLCFARNLTPYVGPLGDLPRAFTAFAYHGNGVAMGSYAGALLSDLATGRPVTRPYPALMRIPAARFPLGRHRRALLAPTVGAYALMDMR